MFRKIIFSAVYSNKWTKRINIFEENRVSTGPFYQRLFCTDQRTDLYKPVTAENMIAIMSAIDPQMENKIKLIMLEAEVARQEGQAVPDLNAMKRAQWDHLLELPSVSSRKKYFKYLYGIERKKENRANDKERRRIAREEALRLEKEKAETESDTEGLKVEYCLKHMSMFARIYEKSMNNFYNYRLLNAIQFGQKLILDCSYDKYMNVNERANAAKQLTTLFAENRAHIEPFDVHFFNCDLNSLTMRTLFRNIPSLKEPWFPLHIHTDCFTRHFPKEQLVYLTPHCRNELTHFDADVIYIVGCMIDKTNHEPISLAKAKEMNLKMAKLPLDKYLSWTAGSGKSLTLNQMTSILLDLKLTNDWEYSLRHVPRRKIFDTEKPVDPGNKILQNRLKRKEEKYLDKILYERQNRQPTSYQKRKKQFAQHIFDDDSKI